MPTCPSCYFDVQPDENNECPLCGHSFGDQEKDSPEDDSHDIEPHQNLPEKPVDEIVQQVTEDEEPETISETENEWQKNRIIDLSTIPAGPSNEELEKNRRMPSLWEQPDQRGRFNGFWVTVKDVLFSPVSFFDTLRTQGDYFMPLIFALIVAFLGGIVSTIWGNVFSSFFQEMFLSMYPQNSYPPNLAAWEKYIMMGSVFMLPAAEFVAIFLSSLIIHFLLIILNGAKNGFEATFRSVCYIRACNLFLFVPILGGLITFFYTLILQIISLKEMHEIDAWKAFLAVFLPIFLLCCCCCAGIAIFASLIAENFKNLNF